MANNIAFQAMGKTTKITTNASTPNNATMFADSPSNQYKIVNHATQPVYVWISPSSSPVNVAAPTGSGANATYAIVVPQGLYCVISGPQCSNTISVQVSAIAEAGTPEIYVTPGEGL